MKGDLPQAMTVGYGARLTLRVENHCGVTLSSAGRYAVRLAARWHESESGAEVPVRAAGATLWPPLRPGRSRELELLLAPPWLPGTYQVHVTACQAELGWFDLARPENALSGTVLVS